MHEEIPERCTEIREILARAREEAIAPQEASRRDAHLAECEACRSAASWLELADELASSMPEPREMSPARMDQLVSAVMQRVAQEPSRTPRRRRAWGWAPSFAGLAALVVVAIVLFRSPDPESMLPQTEMAAPEDAAPKRESARELDESNEIGLGTFGRAEDAREDPAPPSSTPALERGYEDAEAGGRLAARSKGEPGTIAEGEEAVEERFADTDEAGKEKASADEAAAIAARPEGLASREDRADPEAPAPAEAPAAREPAEDSAVAKSRARAQSALLQSSSYSWMIEALGERIPTRAGEADSLRQRLGDRLAQEQAPAGRDSLQSALEELEALWPQDPDSN